MFSVMTIALVLSLVAGCVLVRELEVDTGDAGVSSPPVIEAAAEPYNFPGPLTLSRAAIVNTPLSLTIADNDIDDTLHVRVFMNYDPTTGAFLVSDCTGPSSGNRERIIECPADRLCNGVDNRVGNEFPDTLEVVVSDRDWLTAGDEEAEGQPPLREIAANANRVIRGWGVQCTP